MIYKKLLTEKQLEEFKKWCYENRYNEELSMLCLEKGVNLISLFKLKNFIYY